MASSAERYIFYRLCALYLSPPARVGWKEGGGWHRVPGKLFDSNPVPYLRDVHSSVFQLAWCLLESTRSARLAYET